MAIFVGEWRRIGRVGTFGLWPCMLITRRSQVQILPPLPTSSQALSHWDRASCDVWPVTRSVTRDVSAVALRLIPRRIATGRGI